METKHSANNIPSPALEVFKFVSDNISDFIGMWDMNLRPTYVNPQGMMSVGLEYPNQLQQTSVADFFFAEDVDYVIKQFLPEVFDRGRNECEVRFRHFKTGKAIWMIFNVILVKDKKDNPIGYATISKNITKQKIVEEELKESNNRFVNNIKHAPVAMCVFKGRDYIVEIANELMLELWGKTESQVTGKPVFEGLPEARGQGLEQIIDEVFYTGKKFVAYERPIKLMRKGNLEITYINFVYETIKEGDGIITGIIAVAINVTEQVSARKQLEFSEARFRNLITQSPLPMVVFRGAEQIIEIANKAMLKRWNKTAEELEDKRLVDVFPEIRNQKLPALLDEVYTTGTVYSEKESVSFIQEKDGKTTFYVDFEYSPLLETDGKVSGVIATVFDVTDKVTSRKKIEESEARYHNLIYSSPSAIGILFGEELVITIANDAIIEIWGKGKEIMGKAYFEALPELAEQGYREVFAEVYKTGKPFNAVEMPVNILQNGEMQLKYYNFLLYAQKNANGETDGIGIIATEVTSQALLNKRIRESEQRFAAAVQAVEGIVWTNNYKGEMSGEQQSWAELTGQKYDEYQGYGWANVIHPDDAQPTIDAWKEAVKAVRIFNFEHRVKMKDGCWRSFSIKAIPLKNEDGSLREWVGVHTDIQEQKTFATELEKQVQERTQQLEQNNIELEKMNKELQSFAYISSHDLQEPLRKIQTFASRIAETESKNLSDAGRNYFIRMQDAAFRMQTLIDDLLAYSRTNISDRKYERTDLNKIIDEVRSDLKEELKQKHATLEAVELDEINIIPFQFRQLLLNLLSNSLKFSNPAIPPYIKIKSKIAKGAELNNEKLLDNTHYCHISFSDNGIGFEQQFNHKIFELFQRLHGRHEYSGTGIGLAIVKKIVDNHEGVITAKGEVNKGATFDIFLPQ